MRRSASNGIAAAETSPAAGETRPISERVRRGLSALTAAENRVAQALLDDYPVAGLETVARFAKRAGTSGPTILRFVSRLGFESYAAFQNRLRSEVQKQLQGPLARYPSRPGWGDGSDVHERVGLAICGNIERAVRGLPRGDYADITRLVCDPRRAVFCLGGRFTQMLATYFHHCLRELRPGARLVREGSAGWADYLLDVRRGDILVVFDFRRYQRDVLEFAGGAAAQGAVIILVTDIWNSPIAALAAHVIACPVEVPTAFDSAVAGLAMVEVLIASVVERLGEGAKRRIETLETLRQPFHLESAPPGAGRKAAQTPITAGRKAKQSRKPDKNANGKAGMKSGRSTG
ncbi:RpiR family transcriptional regulator [Hypericibacter terrae]|uniref:RpiR family transcriptional regulator n=1 Tax=Hypericibacter terrae TaxID=2602015 RepID=A0A5J6MKR1_9PROT|nr:MurR/RpiR family transcriptional regulator [Hypericibacter terrae]QEX18098.1 RpiR family transcriptional regulator [Hypericibacter terrae]